MKDCCKSPYCWYFSACSARIEHIDQHNYELKLLKEQGLNLAVSSTTMKLSNYNVTSRFMQSYAGWKFQNSFNLKRLSFNPFSVI